MKKKDFEKIRQNYERRSKYLKKISVGDLVWEAIPRGIDFDYHPAVVKEVNVDEDYVKVVDVTSDNQTKKYSHFLTEEEMIQRGFGQQILDKECEKYSSVIREVIKVQDDNAR